VSARCSDGAGFVGGASSVVLDDLVGVVFGEASRGDVRIGGVAADLREVVDGFGDVAVALEGGVDGVVLLLVLLVALALAFSGVVRGLRRALLFEVANGFEAVR
jgi:hypothetical protein